MAKTQTNPMRKISIVKITLNSGAGKDEEVLKKGLKLLQKFSSNAPVKTITKKRIPGWGLRPGLVIGTKVTIRDNTETLLKRLVAARDNILNEKCFDNRGNFSFGIPEYIDIAGMEYDPDLKIIGLEVAVTLERPGFRVKKKKIGSRSIGKTHKITKIEAINFIKKNFGVEIN